MRLMNKMGFQEVTATECHPFITTSLQLFWNLPMDWPLNALLRSAFSSSHHIISLQSNAPPLLEQDSTRHVLFPRQDACLISLTKFYYRVVNGHISRVFWRPTSSKQCLSFPLHRDGNCAVRYWRIGFHLLLMIISWRVCRLSSTFIGVSATSSGKSAYAYMVLHIIQGLQAQPTLCPLAKFPPDPAILMIYPTKALEEDQVQPSSSLMKP